MLSSQSLFRDEVLTAAPRRQVGLKFGDAAPRASEAPDDAAAVAADAPARPQRNLTWANGHIDQGKGGSHGRHRGWKGGGGRRRQRAHDRGADREDDHGGVQG
eukprot:6821179-Prymnesium_polylepis.1